MLTGSAGAIRLSASVPPTRCINCHVSCKLIIQFSYLISYGLSVVYNKAYKDSNKLHLWLVFIKDMSTTLLLTTVIVLVVTKGLNWPNYFIAHKDGFVKVRAKSARPITAQTQLTRAAHLGPAD